MSQTVLIRSATAADLDAIVDLHTRARDAYYDAGGISTDPAGLHQRREGWRAALASQRWSGWCATLGDQVVGVLGMGAPSPERDTGAVGQLYQLYVDPGSWGRGIGGRLHATFVDRLVASSLSTGLLEVWERNTRAWGFYRQLGWVPDGERRPGPGGADFVILRLAVPSAG